MFFQNLWSAGCPTDRDKRRRRLADESKKVIDEMPLPLFIMTLLWSLTLDFTDRAIAASASKPEGTS